MSRLRYFGRAIQDLTPREAEIMGALVAGERVMEISERLCLSPKTIDSHVQRARKRLQARTTYQAIAAYVERGREP